MRVLHVIPCLDPESGGPATSVPALCDALANSGIHITLFAGHSSGHSLTIEPEKQRYEIKLFSTDVGRIHAGISIYREICRRRKEFDIVNVHSVWNPIATLAAAAARTCRIPYILSPHGMLTKVGLQRRSFLKRSYSTLCERRTIEAASRVRFLTPDETRQSQGQWFKYPGQFNASNGVDLAIGNIQPGDFRQRFPDLCPRRIMLFLGRLHPIKGLEIQLEALAILSDKFPDLTWVLVGPDAGEWGRLSERITFLGLESRVKWVGVITGPERFAALADADVVVMTSLQEGRSMTLNEALAVGVPLVVTDTVNYPEIQSEAAGYVVSRDPSEVAKAIAAIFEAPDKADLMRLAGRRFAAQQLSWTKVANVMKAEFEKVLLGPRNV